MASRLTIGQLAKAVGVNVQTVRYYERCNLLAPTDRMPSGYRMYGHDALRRLRFIKNAQTLGFTLREISDLLTLRLNTTARRGDVQRRTETKLAQMEAKLRDLRALTRALQCLIHACRAGRQTDRCPILKSMEEERGSHHGSSQSAR